jgi:hypothetical protein
VICHAKVVFVWHCSVRKAGIINTHLKKALRAPPFEGAALAASVEPRFDDAKLTLWDTWW